jgi:hypothetical protein
MDIYEPSFILYTNIIIKLLNENKKIKKFKNMKKINKKIKKSAKSFNK